MNNDIKILEETLPIDLSIKALIENVEMTKSIIISDAFDKKHVTWVRKIKNSYVKNRNVIKRAFKIENDRLNILKKENKKKESKILNISNEEESRLTLLIKKADEEIEIAERLKKIPERMKILNSIEVIISQEELLELNDDDFEKFVIEKKSEAAEKLAKETAEKILIAEREAIELKEKIQKAKEYAENMQIKLHETIIKKIQTEKEITEYSLDQNISKNIYDKITIFLENRKTQLQELKKAEEKAKEDIKRAKEKAREDARKAEEKAKKEAEIATFNRIKIERENFISKEVLNYFKAEKIKIEYLSLLEFQDKIKEIENKIKKKKEQEIFQLEEKARKNSRFSQWKKENNYNEKIHDIRKDNNTLSIWTKRIEPYKVCEITIN